jgi:hypothetical protein
MFSGLKVAMRLNAWRSQLTSAIRTRLLADCWLYVAIAAYCLAGLMLLVTCGQSTRMAYSLYFEQWTYLFLFFMPAVALLLDAAWIIVRFNEKRLMAIRRALSPQRLAHLLAGMALLMALMFFQGTFTSIKNILPHLRGGFLYDRILADIDVWVSFGREPGLFLASFWGGGLLSKVVDWNYSGAWFALCFGALFYVVTSPRTAAVRVRYVSMFMLVWVVCGNLIAGLLISAGPAFYGAVTGDKDRFADQLTVLGSGDSMSTAAAFQQYLWSLHESGAAGLGSGISAFPSVHVGLIALNAFFAAEVSRLFGVIAFAYVALVMASSVFLGWHYAIDGYASLLVVAVMHYGLRRLMCPVRKTAADPSLPGAAASA